MLSNLFNQRYKILRELGSKPGRKTCLAEDVQTQAQVVIKLLYLGVDFDWQDLKLFEREAATLQAINHSQIPKYLDSFEFDAEGEKGFALVQEYIPGESLETQLRGGRVFNESEVIQLARSLLAILIYLHSLDPAIIHRDIKPSNIIVTNRSAHHVGDVYLVDFGSVQNIAATQGSTITVVGTYGYMPPEQFGGRTTPASDLYALGATLIFLVTGLHPSELPERELQIEFRNHCQISPSFADWLEWMTEPSQIKRFKTAQIALEQIENPPPRPVLISQHLKNKQNPNQSLSPITKPEGSKIQILPEPTSLEIILPPQGIKFMQILLISCAIPIAINGNISIKTTEKAFWVLQLGAIALIIWILIWSLCKRTRISLDKNSVQITNEIFNYQWAISKPLSLKSYEGMQLFEGIFVSKPRKHLRKNFYYHEDERIFSLQEFHQFTSSEIEWLKAEIENWLKR